MSAHFCAALLVAPPPPLSYFNHAGNSAWRKKLLHCRPLNKLLAVAINCIAVCVILTAKFAKNMRAQLSPLFEATRQVAGQNLDFEVGHSKIKEFEDVLCSFANMKDNLKISLENSANDRLLFAHIHNRRGKRLHARVPTPCTGTVFHGRQKQNF